MTTEPATPFSPEEHRKFMLERNDDCVTFRIRMEREIPRDSMKIKLVVTVALPAKGLSYEEVAKGRVLEVLQAFIPATWRLKNRGRTMDDAEKEFDNLEASARIEPDADYDLEKRLQRAMRAGIALTELERDYTVSVEAMNKLYADMRTELWRQAAAELAELKNITKQNWRLGKMDVDFSKQTFMVTSNKGPYRAEIEDVLTDGTIAGRTNLDRISLIARVEFQSSR